MYHLYKKIQWSLLRIFYYMLLALVAFTGGIATYILAPIPSYYFFGDFAFWKYIRYFHLLNIQLYRMIFLWLSDPKYRGMYAQPLTSPPMIGPDRTNVKIVREWKHGERDCAGCIKCCIKINCTLLDSDTKRCLVYNSPYWNYFSCGRFPVSQEQIDYYQCNKWEMKNHVSKEYLGKENEQAYHF